jgi:glycosyltransferase involved in cell wall biosynthesis
MKREKLISIIIPAYNEEKYISGCLRAIVEFGVKGIEKEDYEIIIVDNGSSDKTVELAERFRNSENLTICSRPNDNIAMLRNFGVSISAGEYLAFVDADCIVPNNWCLRGVEKLKNKNVGAAGCKYSVSEHSSWIAKTWDLNNSAKRINGEVSGLPSGGLFMRKTVFVKLNGFDEKLETNEDFDLCYRIIDNGFKVLSNIKLSVIHLGAPNSFLEFYNREKWHGKHVFEVFMSDQKKKKNRNAVAIAAFYLISYFCIGITILIGIFGYYPPYSMIMALLGVLIFPAMGLSLLKLRRKTYSISNIAKLTVIYICYGTARAVSLAEYFLKMLYVRGGKNLKITNR